MGGDLTGLKAPLLLLIPQAWAGLMLSSHSSPPSVFHLHSLGMQSLPVAPDQELQDQRYKKDTLEGLLR